MKHILIGAVLFMAVAMGAAVFTGCNTQGCTDNHSALPLMGFYSNTTDASMALDSLDMGGVGAPFDSLLIRSGERVSSLYIPFRYDSDETAFFFHYDYPEQGLDDPALNDTVTFRYTTEPYFASEECGAFYIYTIRGLEYTTHLIDRVEIVDSVITNVDMERIKVYFRVAEPEEPEAPDVPDGGDNPDDMEGDGPADNDDGQEPADADGRVAGKGAAL